MPHSIIEIVSFFSDVIANGFDGFICTDKKYLESLDVDVPLKPSIEVCLCS
jgi:hypothetical protein